MSVCVIIYVSDEDSVEELALNYTHQLSFVFLLAEKIKHLNILSSFDWKMYKYPAWS